MMAFMYDDMVMHSHDDDDGLPHVPMRHEKNIMATFAYERAVKDLLHIALSSPLFKRFMVSIFSL